ncbi:hypothetical protein F4813DRAFT_375342 [Daldinia decipiens]|uniref:uncharacterized protein n=1 Tax=Daldinia decipiens TaxID=326647 RepID=UPI0020C34B59|nr:uncharacterized protein F4813DRAFT_375342 [Daldinia decipiens]KAI1653295.1 hypothetical protein F4813DRAFT_375342 [Daldinia decipiens]
MKMFDVAAIIPSISRSVTRLKRFAYSAWKRFMKMDTFDYSRLSRQVMDFLGSLWKSFTAYIAQPHVYWAIIVWALVFTIVVTFGLCLGFGPAGVITGTIAAGFQSAMYGGFTPAGGIFASLTSLAMLHLLAPSLIAAAAIIAMILAVIIFNLVPDS